MQTPQNNSPALSSPPENARRDSDDDALSGEKYLAIKYCSPRSYWRCLTAVGPLTRSLLEPRYWLQVVELYCGNQPSLAAKRLHQQVEDARAAFRVTQDNIYPQLPDRKRLSEYYAKEDLAWERFNARKEQSFKDYLKALKSGVVKKRKRRRGRPCAGALADGAPCDERVYGKKKLCEIHAKERHREAARAYRAKLATPRDKNPLAISPENSPFGIMVQTASTVGVLGVSGGPHQKGVLV